MKCSIHFLCTFLLFNVSVLAQQKDISFLQKNLDQAKTIYQKIDVLNDYADTLCLYKADTGRLLAMEALQLSHQYKYYKGIGEATHSLGLTHFRRRNDSALYYFHQSRAAFLQQDPGLSKLAFTLNNLSRTYGEILQFDSAAYWAKEAIKAAQNAKEISSLKNRWLMFGNGALANAYEGQSLYDSASLYFLKAILLAEKNKDKKMEAVYLKGLALIQAALGNYQKAIEFTQNAIAIQQQQEDYRAITFLLSDLGAYNNKIKNYSEATLMADSSIRLGSSINVFNMIGRNYSTLGTNQMEQLQYHNALKFFKKGLQLAQFYKNSKSAIGSLYKKIGEAYEKMDSLPQAKEYYTKALEMSEGDNAFKTEINYLLSKLAYKEADYRGAYQYLQEYQHFRNEVYSNEKVKTIQELNTRYETQKKDQQLQLFLKDKQLQQQIVFAQLQQIEKDRALKNEQQLQIVNYRLEHEKQNQLLQIQQLDLENSSIKEKEQATQLLNTKAGLQTERQQKELSLITVHNQRNWFIYLFSAILVAGMVSILFFNRYKLLQTIQSQKELLQQRHRISQDLHDEVGATLSGISMYSHILKQQLDNNNIAAVQNSANIIQQNSLETVDKLNDIVWLVNPDKDSLQQLLQRLHDYANNLAVVKNIKVITRISDDFSEILLPENSRRHIYLFCKEAIINAIKYSEATELVFEAHINRGELQLKIADNGCGFDTRLINAGNGISNMQQRADTLNGTISLISEVGKGTTVQLIAPI